MQESSDYVLISKKYLEDRIKEIRDKKRIILNSRKKAYQKYGSSDVLYQITSNLMNRYSVLVAESRALKSVLKLGNIVKIF